MKKVAGYLDKSIIEHLKLNITEGEIILSETSVCHMLKHKEDFERYFVHIEHIISNPDYVGTHPHEGGVEFYKQFGDDFVLIAVRETRLGTLYVRSLYVRKEKKMMTLIQKGLVKKAP